MKLTSGSWVLIALGCGIVAGCGERPAPPTPPNATASMAGSNRRYQMKNEYKQVIGKNGQLTWKQGMKIPDAAKAAGSAAPGKPAAPANP